MIQICPLTFVLQNDSMVKKTDGSTGGGPHDSVFGIRSDDENGEGGEEEGGNGSDSDEDDGRVDVDEIVLITRDREGGTSLGVGLMLCLVMMKIVKTHRFN